MKYLSCSTTIYKQSYTILAAMTWESPPHVYAQPDESAMAFKEDFIKKNSKNSKNLNLNSMRIGINTLVSLSNMLSNRKVYAYTVG